MNALLGDVAGRLAEVMREAGAAGFSGVVRVEVGGAVVHESAHGFADRAHGIANRVDTRIGIASGAKGFTAMTVMRLVERGTLTLDTTARSLLGSDLPLIDAGVTIQHLLSHRSGIGDYLDETTRGGITDYVMPVPVHRLASPAEFVPVLDGHPMTSSPGERFAYNNSGYVLLAVLCERATGASFYDLVDELVCRPAGLTHTGFLRMDELPGDAAAGYLYVDGLRTNVLHLPVRGGGDGGIFTTAQDVGRLWRALVSGRVVTSDTLSLMTRRHGVTAKGTPYGLGLWLDAASDAMELEGYDAGQSFRSVHRPSRAHTWCILSNTSDGAWPVAERVAALLGR